MYFIHGGRASGKTTYLLKMSADTGIPILTTNYWRISFYEGHAKELGLKIPKPILWKDSKLGMKPGSKVLIDNGEETLNKILNHNTGVTCEVMVISDPVMHIESCFLDKPELFPSELLGGEFESMDIERAYQCGRWSERLKEE